MGTQETLAKRDRNRRQSLRALPVYGALAAASGVLVYFVPRWWSWVILVVTVFTLLGDLLNVAFSKRQPSSSPRGAE